MNSNNILRDRYFNWLSTQVSPAQLSELYMAYPDIERFCLERNVIKKNLFELTSLTDVRKVMETVDSNKAFRFTYKRQFNKMSSAIHFYYRFAKAHPDLLTRTYIFEESTDDASQMKTDETQAIMTVESATLAPNLIQDNSEISSDENAKKNLINFSSLGSMAYTRPIKFSYFGEEYAYVYNWTQLYVCIVKCLLEDYPHIFRIYLNRSFKGEALLRFDLADESGVGSMTAPKQVAEHMYLETNISATDIVRKIKQLLDLCNVDYENLEVYYKHLKPVTNLEPEKNMPEVTSHKDKKSSYRRCRCAREKHP